MNNQKKENDRFIIGLGGGHRQYQINNVTYVVDGKFAKPTHSEDDKTLSGKLEQYVGSEFADLTLDDDIDRMEQKPVRSTAEKRAKKDRDAR